jgi:tetratricopeptide (TPR) repeat protein
VSDAPQLAARPSSVEEAQTCPRCGSAARYEVCATCRLALHCPACAVRLADPLRQRSCQVCATRIEQPPYEWPMEGEPGDEAPEPLDAPAPAPASEVDDLLRRSSAPGAARRHVADYAAALAAQGRAREALEAAERALREDGDEPAQLPLRMLHAHCSQQLGDVDGALNALLDALEDDPDGARAVASQIHAMLPAANAHAARLRLLDGRAAVPASRESEAALALLELQAAALEQREDRAEAALERVREALGDAATEPLRDVLSQTSRLAPTDAGTFATLARIEQRADLLLEAAADADRALALGVPAGDDPLAGARFLEFRAGLYPPGESNLIAARYLEAGRQAYLQDDYDYALDLFGNAIAANPLDPEPCWYRADLLRLVNRNKPVDERRAALEQAVVEAQAGEPDAERAWPFLVLALCLDQLAQADPERGRGLTHQACAALERRILLDDGDAGTWALLAHRYMVLGWLGLAAAAAEEALLRGPTAAWHYWVGGLLRLQTGDPSAASTLESALDGSELDPTERGVIQYLLGRYEDAAASARGCVDDPIDGLKARCLLGRALLALEREDEAAEQFAQLWALVDAGDPRIPDMSIESPAGVAYLAGHDDEAIEWAEPRRRRFTEVLYEAGDVHGPLILAHLSRGDVPAARAVADDSLAHWCDVYAIRSRVDDLNRLATRLDREDGSSAAAAAREIAAQLERHAERVGRDAATPAADVAAMQSACERDDLDQPVRDAVELALSRLLIDDDDGRPACERCVALLERGAFGTPERMALTDRLLTALDPALRNEAEPWARALLTRAVDSAPEPARPQLSVRLAVVSLAAGEIEAARDAAALSDRLTDDELAGLLRRLVPPERLPEVSRAVHELGDARFGLALGRMLDEAFSLNVEDDAIYWPLATPIVLELANDLVPEDTSAEGPLFATRLPAMRDRLKAATGVQVPGVRVRQIASLESHAFRARLGEELPLDGTVRRARVFVPLAPDEVTARLGEDADVTPDRDPATGLPASWVAPPALDGDDGQRAERRGGLGRFVDDAKDWVKRQVATGGWARVLRDGDAWTEPAAYALRVLEGHLRANVAVFVTVDVVSDLLEEWRAAGLVDEDAALSDAELTRLTAILRELAREGVCLRPRAGALGAALGRRSYAQARDACRAAFDGGE